MNFCQKKNQYIILYIKRSRTPCILEQNVLRKILFRIHNYTEGAHPDNKVGDKGVGRKTYCIKYTERRKTDRINKKRNNKQEDERKKKKEKGKEMSFMFRR